MVPKASIFLPTDQHLAVTRGRYPAFPRDPAALVRLIKHLYKRLNDDANALLKPYGLNHPEYNLLMMLYGTEGFALHPSELASAAGEKLANITRLTDQLCKKGLVDRSASLSDRRRLQLTLSADGVQLVEQLLPDICVLLERQGQAMQPREMAQLERLLKKFLDHLSESN